MAKNFNDQSQFSINDFTIIKQVGKGAFSTVFECKNTQNLKKYALKIINTETLNKHHLALLKKEIDIHRELNHRNIIQFHGYFVFQNYVILVLDFCQGGNLFSYINKKKHLSEKEIRKIFNQVLEAISYIHSKDIILRDLKPENLLIDLEDMRIRVCDLGWAAKTDDLKWLKSKAGTFSYMSPESLQGKLQNKQSDIWSLGVLLYELFYNIEPYQGSSCESQYHMIMNQELKFGSREISRENKELIKQMLQIEPQNRITLQRIMRKEFLLEKEKKTMKIHNVFLENSSEDSTINANQANVSNMDESFSSESLEVTQKPDVKKIQELLRDQEKPKSRKKIKKKRILSIEQSNNKRFYFQAKISLRKKEKEISNETKKFQKILQVPQQKRINFNKSKTLKVKIHSIDKSVTSKESFKKRQFKFELRQSRLNNHKEDFQKNFKQNKTHLSNDVVLKEVSDYLVRKQTLKEYQFQETKPDKKFSSLKNNILLPNFVLKKELSAKKSFSRQFTLNNKAFEKKTFKRMNSDVGIGIKVTKNVSLDQRQRFQKLQEDREKLKNDINQLKQICDNKIEKVNKMSFRRAQIILPQKIFFFLFYF